MPWRKNTLQPFALGNNSEPAHSVHGSQSSVVGVDSDVNVGDLDLEGLNHFLQTPSELLEGESEQRAALSFQVISESGDSGLASQGSVALEEAEPLDPTQFGKVVSQAFLSNVRIHDIEFPWESTFCKEKIFG